MEVSSENAISRAQNSNESHPFPAESCVMMRDEGMYELQPAVSRYIRLEVNIWRRQKLKQIQH